MKKKKKKSAKLRRSMKIGQCRAYASTPWLCAQRGWIGVEGGDEAARGGGPHYKFNLTNGSENLETMEYMKCGRVYHDARHRVGSTGNIVRADPYSPANVPEYEGQLDPGIREGTGEYRGKGERKGKTHAGKTRSRETRTVPVAFQPAHVCGPSISRAL